MSAHTKGPLRLERGEVFTDCGELLRTNGTQTPMTAGPDRLEALFNMKRIVALWNAAEELGLTTGAIEAGAIQRAVEDHVAIERAHAAIDAAIRSLTQEQTS